MYRGFPRDRMTGREPNRKEGYLNGTEDSLFTSMRLGVTQHRPKTLSLGLGAHLECGLRFPVFGLCLKCATSYS